MNVTIILAMHGMPPRDFPKSDMMEYFSQYNPFHHGGPNAHQGHDRFHELEAKMRAWPRNPQNDAFYGAAYRLADSLKSATGYPVVVGFNEFCAPDLDQAYDQAVAAGAETVVVITPMMTQGGIHSEIDIPQTIERAKTRHPGVRFSYVWPFNTDDVAGFLKGQIQQKLAQNIPS